MARYDYLNNYLNGNMNQYKGGGMLNRYDVGGTHEQNPNGGIPVGPNSTVEQGEASVNLDQQGNAVEKPTGKKYIFSDRQVWTPEEIKAAGLPPSRKPMTASSYMKKLDAKFKDRTGAKDAAGTFQEFTKRAQGLAETKRQREEQLNAAMQANAQQNMLSDNTEVPPGMEEYAEGGDWYANNNPFFAETPGAVTPGTGLGAISQEAAPSFNTTGVAGALTTGMDLYGAAKGNTTANMGESILGNAAKGAMAGAAFGPWGAAIGGVAGGIAGGIGAKAKQKEDYNIASRAGDQANAGMPNSDAWTATGGYITSQPAKYCGGGKLMNYCMGGKMHYADGGIIDPPTESRRKPKPGTATIGGVEMSLTDPVQEWTKEYVQSPNYLKRLQSSGYKDPLKTQAKRLDNVERATIAAYNSPPTWPVSSGMVGSRTDIHGRKIYSDATGDARNYKISGGSPELAATYNMREVIPHEFGHIETKGGMNKYDIRSFRERLTPESRKSKTFIDERGKTIRTNPGHDMDPYEGKSDLNSIRYQLRQQNIMNPGTDDATQEHLDSLKDSTLKERMYENYGKEGTLWLMNNIAANKNRNASAAPMARSGGFLRAYPNGGMMPIDPPPGTPIDPPVTGAASYPTPKTREEALARIQAQNQGYFESTRSTPQQYNLTRADLFPESEGARMAAIEATNAQRASNQVAGQARMKEQSDNNMRAKGLDPNDPEQVKAYWNQVEETRKAPRVVPEWQNYSSGWFDTGVKKRGAPNYGCLGQRNLMADGGPFGPQLETPEEMSLRQSQGTLGNIGLTADLANQFKASRPYYEQNPNNPPFGFTGEYPTTPVNQVQQKQSTNYGDMFKGALDKSGDFIKKNSTDIMRAYPVMSNILERSAITKPTGTYYSRLDDSFNVPQTDEARMLRDVNTAYGNKYRALSGTAGQRNAMMTALGSQEAEMRSKMYGTEEDRQQQLELQKQQYQSGIRQYNAQAMDRGTEAYARDLGNYETQKSKFTGAIGTDIGEIAKEQDFMKKVGELYGYDKDGNYINKKTGKLITPEERARIEAAKTPSTTVAGPGFKMGGYLTRRPAKY